MIGLNGSRFESFSGAFRIMYLSLAGDVFNFGLCGSGERISRCPGSGVCVSVVGLDDSSKSISGSVAEG